MKRLMIVLTLAVAATGSAFANPGCTAGFEDPRGDVRSVLDAENRSLAPDALDIRNVATSMDASTLSLSITVEDLAALEEHPTKEFVTWRAYWATGASENPWRYDLTAKIDIISGDWFFEGFADNLSETRMFNVQGSVDGDTITMSIPKPDAPSLQKLIAVSQDSAPFAITTIGYDNTEYASVDVC